MELSIYYPLPFLSRPEIRWPGQTSLEDWMKREKYGAIRVRINNNSALDDIAAWEMYLRQTQLDDAAKVVSSDRAKVVRLLLQEWARNVDDNYLDLVLSDEPRSPNRVRSYKGVIENHCRVHAKCFDQLESECSDKLTVILNRMQFPYAGLESCYRYYGDTFRSFGVFGWPRGSLDKTVMVQILNCFGFSGRLWRWESDRLIPIVCTNSSSFFFVQKVASEMKIEVVLYSPKEMIQDYKDIAIRCFGAIEASIDSQGH